MIEGICGCLALDLTNEMVIVDMFIGLVWFDMFSFVFVFSIIISLFDPSCMYIDSEKREYPMLIFIRLWRNEKINKFGVFEIPTRRSHPNANRPSRS